MKDFFVSDGLRLSRYLVSPLTAGATNGPAVLICHGFPSAPLDASKSALTFPQLCDRVANTGNWSAMTFTFRGCGTSEGQFSLAGWRIDLLAAVDHLVESVSPSAIWIVGSSTGGSLALANAANDPRIAGIALLGARADFDDWAARPNRFLDQARELGAISDPTFPKRTGEWAAEFRRVKPLEAVRQFAPRPLLVLHGDQDESVPVSDARRFVDAHGSAELRVIPGAGHRLRHDPRAIAVLLGWLERQRASARSRGDAA